MALTKAVRALLAVLARWNGGEASSGIDLEISAVSPSDGAAAQSPLAPVDSDTIFSPAGFKLEPSRRGYWYGDNLGSLSNPEVVTSFSFLYRSSRIIEWLPLFTVMDYFPGLRQLRLEARWMDLSFLYEGEFFAMRQWVHWPAMKRVHLFAKEYDEEFFRGSGPDSTRKLPSTARRFAWTMAICFGKLEHFSAYHVIEALDFLERFLLPVGSTGVVRWKNLQYLTLTSKILTEEAGALIDRFLQAAGKAVDRGMPMLLVMEIFHAPPPEDMLPQAAVFRYLVKDKTAFIFWESTWEYRLSPATKQVWTAVVENRQPRRTPCFKRLTLAPVLPPGGPPPHPTVAPVHSSVFNRFKFLHANLVTRELILDPSSWRYWVLVQGATTTGGCQISLSSRHLTKAPRAVFWSWESVFQSAK